MGHEMPIHIRISWHLHGAVEIPWVQYHAGKTMQGNFHMYVGISWQFHMLYLVVVCRYKFITSRHIALFGSYN